MLQNGDRCNAAAGATAACIIVMADIVVVVDEAVVLLLLLCCVYCTTRGGIIRGASRLDCVADFVKIIALISRVLDRCCNGGGLGSASVVPINGFCGCSCWIFFLICVNCIKRKAGKGFPHSIQT